MTILDPHTATSLNESIKGKRKLSWSVTEQVAHQLAHSTQHTHTTSSRYRHNRRHAEWGIHIFKSWFWTPFKWFQSGFIIIYTSVLFEARIFGVVGRWMRRTYRIECGTAMSLSISVATIDDNKLLRVARPRRLMNPPLARSCNPAIPCNLEVFVHPYHRCH
jgi:hypothetical protein